MSLKNFPLFLSLILSISIFAQDEEVDLFARSLPSDDTVKVRVGFSVINITDIIEKDENILFDGVINLVWKDERLAYDFDSTNFYDENGDIDVRKAPPVMYNGDFQVKELFEGWRPHFMVANGVGNRTPSNMSVKVWPDGTCAYSEEFACVAETPMNLRLYPFDTQELEVFIYPQGHARDEVMFIVDEHLEIFWNRNLGIADWERKGVKNRERAKRIPYDDGTEVLASELKTTIIIERKSMHILLGIIFPMIILVSLTWSVFWMIDSNVTDRINISFIGILSVVTYYLVIQDSIPEIAYLTFLDVFIVITFLIVASSVIVSLKVDQLIDADQQLRAKRLDRYCRWVFPLSYIVLTCAAMLFFFKFMNE